MSLEFFAPAPVTSDNKPPVTINAFPEDTILYQAGAADDPTLGIGEGVDFILASDAAGDATQEFGFNDAVWLGGGAARYTGALLGDWMTFETFAPATPATPNALGTGNCNLVDPGVGAPILIVPANGDGAYDVDLAQAVPVPALDAEGAANGYYDWQNPTGTGRGTLNAGSPEDSGFNLYAIQIGIARFVAKVQLLGSGIEDFNFPAIRPKRMLPHWKMRVILHNSGHAGLQVTWKILMSRKKTI